jgi:hypothetical protein
VRTAALSGARRLVDVVFSFTGRNTDVTQRYSVRVDVTEQFPFLATSLHRNLRRGRSLNSALRHMELGCGHRAGREDPQTAYDRSARRLVPGLDDAGLLQAQLRRLGVAGQDVGDSA